MSNAFPYDRRLISVCGLLFAHSLRARGQDTAKSHSSKSNQVMNNMWTIQFLRVLRDERILQYTISIFAPNLCYFYLTFYPLQKKQKWKQALFSLWQVFCNLYHQDKSESHSNRLDFFNRLPFYMQVLFWAKQYMKRQHKIILFINVFCFIVPQ